MVPDLDSDLVSDLVFDLVDDLVSDLFIDLVIDLIYVRCHEVALLAWFQTWLPTCLWTWSQT